MIESIHSLTRKIPLDHYNSIVFGAAEGAEIYIVGGFIRDLIVNRVSLDRDYVVGGSLESLVDEVVRLTQGRVVELGKDGLLRIALKGGGTLDFTPLRGQNIEEDLSNRDFTVNAIAWSPVWGVIDPTGGMDDLERGFIRMISSANLVSDPIRILRAYRLAGELSFEIEGMTRIALRKSARLVTNTSSERITSEIFKTLNLKNPADTVSMIVKDGLLTKLISCNYSALDLRVKALSHLFQRHSDSNLKYRINFEHIISQGLKRSGLLALAMLLQGMPEHRFILSSKIIRRISRLDKGAALLDNRKSAGMLSRDDLCDLFEATGEETSDLLMIRDLPQYMIEFRNYERIQRKCMLSAEQIGAAIKIGSGPSLGRAIRAVRRAEFVGDIKSVDEALAFLQSTV